MAAAQYSGFSQAVIAVAVCGNAGGVVCAVSDVPFSTGVWLMIVDMSWETHAMLLASPTLRP